MTKSSTVATASGLSETRSMIEVNIERQTPGAPLILTANPQLVRNETGKSFPFLASSPSCAFLNSQIW
jgi:hypothetical protein